MTGGLSIKIPCPAPIVYYLADNYWLLSVFSYVYCCCCWYEKRFGLLI